MTRQTEARITKAAAIWTIVAALYIAFVTVRDWHNIEARTLYHQRGDK